MNNQLVDNINAVLNMANMKRNPQEIMQMLIQQNPQIKQMLVQVQNMAQGRTHLFYLSPLTTFNHISAVITFCCYSNIIVIGYYWLFRWLWFLVGYIYYCVVGVFNNNFMEQCNCHNYLPLTQYCFHYCLEYLLPYYLNQ